MQEIEKVSTRNEASQPIGVKHVATTCAMPPVSHQCGIEPQASPKKKKKERKKERKKKAENTSMKTCRGSKHSFCLFI